MKCQVKITITSKETSRLPVLIKEQSVACSNKDSQSQKVQKVNNLETFSLNLEIISMKFTAIEYEKMYFLRFPRNIYYVTCDFIGGFYFVFVNSIQSEKGPATSHIYLVVSLRLKF